jgi:hypothetical protein
MAFDGDDGVPVVGDSLPILGGRQFQIMWLADSTGRAPAEFNGSAPAPGQAFVSPALRRKAGGDEGFRRRFGLRVDPRSANVKWDRILAFSGEYLAFATVPEGRDLSPRSRLLGFDAAAFGAPEAAAPESAADFELPTGPVAVPFYIDERVPSSTQALLAGSLLLVVPGMLVLALGVSSRSELRSVRRDALAYLGAGGRSLSGFDAVEIGALSIPTAAVASLISWVALGQLSALPAGTVQYAAGDLRPTLSASAVASTVVIGLPILMGMIAPKASAWRTRRRRRRSSRSGPVLAFVPLVVSVVAALIPTEARFVPFLAVVVSIVVVVPKVSTGALPHLGGLVGPGSATRLLAARRLQWGDLRASSLMRVTTFAVVIVVVVSAMNLAAGMPSKDSGLPHGIVTVNVTGGLDGNQVAALAERVPGIAIAAITPGQVLVVDCERLALLVAQNASTCRTSPDHIVSIAAASPLGQLGAISFGQPKGGDPVAQVIARVNSNRQNEVLQASANAMFGPSQVLGWDRLGPNPVVGWVSTLGLAAILLLTAALLLLLVNSVRFPSASDLALRWLAASDRTHLSALRWEHHTVLLAAVALGAGYGLLVNSAGQPAQITRVEHWPLAIAALAAGLVVAIVVDIGLNTIVRGLWKPLPGPATNGMPRWEEGAS